MALGTPASRSACPTRSTRDLTTSAARLTSGGIGIGGVYDAGIGGGCGGSVEGCTRDRCLSSCGD